MRILIVGAGALGGYYGARLMAAGRDVTFLVRAQRARQLAETGLQLTSPFGDLSLPGIKTVVAEELRESFDLIILSCKAHDLAGAVEAFAPAVGEGSAILPLLNGMAHMDALDMRFGREHVLGGSTPISAARDAEGRIQHLNQLTLLQFGDRDEPDGARIKEIGEALTVHGLGTSLEPVIMQDMWQKWVSINTSAGMTCLMRASIGDIVAAGGTPLVLQLMREAASVAAREGFTPTEEYLGTVVAKFTQAGSPFTASMLRDIEAGRPIEAFQIVGDMLQRGQKHGLDTPLLAVVYAHLRCYEERRVRELNG